MCWYQCGFFQQCKQEHSKRAEPAERRACLARDRRDGRRYQDHPQQGEVVASRERTRTGEHPGAEGGGAGSSAMRTPPAMMLAPARTPAKLRSRPDPPPPLKLTPALTASNMVVGPVAIALLPRAPRAHRRCRGAAPVAVNQHLAAAVLPMVQWRECRGARRPRDKSAWARAAHAHVDFVVRFDRALQKCSRQPRPVLALPESA